MHSGCFHGHLSKWKFVVGLLCLIGVFFAVKSICLAQESDKKPVLRNRVYKFRYISAKDAKERLISLGIGRNINELPHNSLIVESDNSTDLVKASSLLGIIDSEQPHVIKTILMSPDIQKLPRNDEIAAQVDGINIGTFKEPPTDPAIPSAIVDIHDLDLIAIAPEPLFDKIADAVLRLQAIALTLEAKRSSEPNAPKPMPAEDMADEITEAQVPVLVEDANDKQKAAGPSQEMPVEAEDLPATGLLEMIGRIEGQTDTEDREEKEDIFGDELLEALAEAEKLAQQELAEAEKVAQDKSAERISEIEEVRPVEGPAKVAPPQEVADSEPAPSEAETLGISKEELATIVQSEVAKALEVQAAVPPAEVKQPIARPVVPEPEQEQEKVQAEELIEPGEQDDVEQPAEYLEQLAIPDAEKELDLTITLPEKVEITALVEMVGKLLSLNYIYDEKQIKGDVMLKVHDGKVKVKDAYALLESVLKFRGFVMTRRGQLVTIVPQAQALDNDPTFRTSPQDIQPGDVIVTSIFHLEHVDTASAEALLKNMKLGIVINSIPENGTLIVTDYAYRMGRIEELLNMIDIPGKPRKFQFRQLQYTVAAEVLPKIQTLAQQLGSISVSISVTQTTAPAAPAKPLTAAERRTAARRPTPTPAPARKPAQPGEEVVYLDADERTNRILMIGLAEDIDIVNQLIDTLDIETPDLRIIKEYEIQHVDPTQIIDTLNELGVVSTQVASRIPTQRRTSARPGSRTGQPAAPGTSPASAESGPLEEEPQISILEATNSLLINALPAQHAIIALVIAHVDRELEEATLPYVIYPLENQDPQELADVLAKLIEKTTRVKATAAAAPDAKVQTRPTATTTPSRLEEEITIVADPKSYSIIVYASKKNQQWISSIIKALDEYRPQVLLDVTLVEISKNDQFDYDLDMVSKLAMGSGMDYLTNSLLSTFPPKQHLAEATMITTDAGKTGKGFYADRHIQLLFDVMDKKGYGRVLARPKLLVNDNEKGTINATETTYITRTTTTYRKVEDEERPIESTTFEPYDAGITLDITPHISKGNNLRLIVELKRSDFDRTSSDGTEPYDKSESNVTTTVTVPDRSTIILGGMEKINQSKSGSKIPLLGDIPLLGGLFKSIHNTDEQKRIYIFVKAHILRPGEEVEGFSDIEKISEKNRALFEGLESKFQKLEDWPGIKPEPMDPLKILEEDIELPQ